MGTEDTLNGATAAMTLFNAYMGTVAEEIGMERAGSLYTKMCENMGAIQGKMLKEQAGTEEIDTKTAWSLVKNVPENLGITSKVVRTSVK